MLNSDDGEILSGIVKLFGYACRSPVTLYVLDGAGEIALIIGTDKRLAPPYCQTHWDLNDDQDKEAREAALLDRAKRAATTSATKVAGPCHSEFTNFRQSITIDYEGKPIAVVQFGPLATLDVLVADDAEHLAGHDRTSNPTEASDGDAADVGLPAAYGSRHDSLPDEALVHSFVDIVRRYLSQVAKARRTQTGAYHELFLHFANSLHQADALLKSLPADTPHLREKIEGIHAAVMGSQTVLHGLTNGAYLPKRAQFRKTKIRDAVEIAYQLCRAEARERGIGVEIDIAPIDMTIRASPQHLESALNNLMANAVKYSYSSSVRTDGRYIRVRGRVSHRQEDGFEISISNYGIEIEPDEYDLIFTESYKGRRSLREYRAGAGQGLAITKRMIELHRGTISVVSTPEGRPTSDEFVPHVTRFTLWLPLAQPESTSDKEIRR